MYGILILIGYFTLMMIVTWLFTEKSKTKEEFYVGNRKMGTWGAALSIAATWIWAPSLFVSAEKAYLNGFAGIFWFLVPNVICLLIFIPFAKQIRKELPEGITLSGYMRGKYSERVKNIYLVELIGLATMSTVVQLVAGSKMLSSITGLPFWVLTIMLALLAYSYSQRSGIKASITSDIIQMLIILSVCIMLVSGTSKGQLRVSQFFSVDTARSLVKMNEYYPNLMERVIKREPNAYIAALYWDSEMFGRRTKNRKQLEKNEPQRDYKAELIEMFSNMGKYFDTKHKMYVATRYRNFFLQVHTIVNQNDCREIYEGLISGDPKLRSFRALYQRIFGRYIEEAKKVDRGGVVNG